MTDPMTERERRPRAGRLICVLAAAGLGLGMKCTMFPALKTPGFKVTRITGLETFEVEIQEKNSYQDAEYHTVRLQGFEAAYDKETRAELAQAMNELLLNKRVHLEYDNPGHPWKGDHGEWLAYVKAGDKLVNAELIRRGLGRYSMSWSPLRYRDELSRAEYEARQARRGLWGRSDQVY